jgi:hypothetical protein
MTRPIDRCTIAVVRLVRDDRGVFTIANCIAVAFCGVLMGLVFNVGHVLQQKVELQNTADAAAYSAAIWQARGMNAVTATNHVIGEVLSFVVLHHAFGGKNLDEGTAANTAKADAFLRTWKRAASIVQECTCAYGKVRPKVLAEATLLEGKVNLKFWLGIDYFGKFTVKTTLWPWPWTRPLAIAFLRMLEIWERKVGSEYVLLNGIETMARGLLPIKVATRDLLLPAMKKYTDRVVETVPGLALETAETIGRLNGVPSTLFGRGRPEPRLALGSASAGPYPARLPVEKDPFADATTPDIPAELRIPDGTVNCNCPTDRTANMRRQIVKTTQLARATFPWVLYHREPVINAWKFLERTRLLMFAGQDPWSFFQSKDPPPPEQRSVRWSLVPFWVGAMCTGAVAGLSFGFDHLSDVYREFTAGKSIELCDELQTSRRHQLWLYVMEDAAPPDKGYEGWTEDQVAADRLFTVIGLAYQTPPVIMGEPMVYRQSHPNGRVAYAQAMIYNGNRQIRPKVRIDLTCKRIVPEHQAIVGWDTLNWLVEDLARDRVRELRGGGGFEVNYPKIRVNWQAKLVPGTGTRLFELTHADQLPEPFRTVVQGQWLEEIPSSLRTH